MPATISALVAQQSNLADIHVYENGNFDGQWHDDTSFESNRYMDSFGLRNGQIVSPHVWSDSAEILLDKAGLSEEPL